MPTVYEEGDILNTDCMEDIQGAARYEGKHIENGDVMTKEIMPISPQEIRKNKMKYLPREVILIVNGILGKRFNGQYKVIIYKDEVVDELERRLSIIKKAHDDDGVPFDRNKIYSEHMLDFEQVYRDAGWDVEFQKKSYGDDSHFKEHWVFKVKVKND